MTCYDAVGWQTFCFLNANCAKAQRANTLRRFGRVPAVTGTKLAPCSEACGQRLLAKAVPRFESPPAEWECCSNKLLLTHCLGLGRDQRQEAFAPSGAQPRAARRVASDCSQRPCPDLRTCKPSGIVALTKQTGYWPRCARDRAARKQNKRTVPFPGPEPQAART